MVSKLSRIVPKLSQSYLKVVSKLSQSCPKVVPKLSQSCLKVASELFQSCLKFSQKKFSRFSLKSSQKSLQVVSKLFQVFEKIGLKFSIIKITVGCSLPRPTSESPLERPLCRTVLQCISKRPILVWPLPSWARICAAIA